MPALPTLRQLQYLAALEDFGSFSKAAEYCHVTQSTLSAGIASLEEILGQTLVNRSHRQISLTPLGLDIVDKGRNMLVQAGDIVAIARKGGEILSGTVRLGLIPTIAPYFLPRLLPRMKKNADEVTLSLQEDLSDRLLTQLKRGTLDLALFAFPYETPGMKQITLFHEDFYLATAQGYWQKKSPVTLTSLKNEKLLLLDEGHCLREHALEACKLRPAQARRTFGATSLPTLIQMVGHGYGVTLLPEMVVREISGSEKIDLLPFKQPAPKREIGLVWRENSPRQKTFEKLAEIMADIE